MNKYLSLLSILISFSVYGQTNTFPSSGYVGIGTNSPAAPLNMGTPANSSVSSIKIGTGHDPSNINVPFMAVAGGYNIDFAT